ncbi:MAG: helix-turn-helix domain-containing protein [Pseudomonadota bacterium]
MSEPSVNGDPIRQNCALDRVFKLLAGEWMPQVIWTLGTNGPTRFNDLQRLVEGISPKVLTERLRLLEAEQVVGRHQEPTVPPKVTYSLTAKGQSLHESFKVMEKSASDWFDEDRT